MACRNNRFFRNVLKLLAGTAFALQDSQDVQYKQLRRLRTVEMLPSQNKAKEVMKNQLMQVSLPVCL
jgi:hypothetical protein